MPYFQFIRANIRWLAGGFLLAFYSSFGQTFFIAIWSGDIRSEFGLSHGDFGFLYMSATLLSAMTLPFIGRSLDLFPIPNIAVVVISALSITCFVMAGVKSTLVLFVVIYALRLFGQGMLTHTSVTAMGRWYAENRGKAVSIATLGFQFGEAFLPIIFVSLATIVGWRSSWVVAAAMLLFIALPAVYLLMRVERIPHSKILVDDVAAIRERQWTRAEVLRDSQFWLLCFGVFAPAFIGTSIFFHQVYLVELKGWTMELFTSSFVIMAATTAVFSLLAGVIIDRFNARMLLPVFLIPLGAGCICLAYFTAPWAIFLYMVLLGVSYGISTALFGALWPEIYGTVHLGSVRSIIVAMMVFASALGPGTTGWLIDRGVPFTDQLVVMAIYCVAVSVLMLFAARNLSIRHNTHFNGISA